MVSDLPVYRRNTTSVTVSIQKRANFVAWLWNQERTEKLVNGKQHSVWLVPTGMKRLPQNVLLNFRLEFPKSDLTIYLPSGISEIFRQMVSTPRLQNSPYFCVFKYARAVKQKVWNEAENRERDWGETLKIRHVSFESQGSQNNVVTKSIIISVLC